MKDADECPHQWRPSSSEDLRDQISVSTGWADYEYCPCCHAFREAVKR